MLTADDIIREHGLRTLARFSEACLEHMFRRDMTKGGWARLIATVRRRKGSVTLLIASRIVYPKKELKVIDKEFASK